MFPPGTNRALNVPKCNGFLGYFSDTGSLYGILTHLYTLSVAQLGVGNYEKTCFVSQNAKTTGYFCTTLTTRYIFA